MEQFQWSEHTPTNLVCVDKWQETPDCISFMLANQGPQQPFTFLPGQFITLSVEINGVMNYRAYSLSSIPNQTKLQLTVKRVTGGKVSNYLCDHLQVGQSLSVLPPTGQFHLNQPHSDNILLLSAGCGITPVMSMARALLADQTDQSDIHFIHAATSTQQIIYHAELLEMEKQYPRFKLNIMLEDTTGTDYPQGRLTQAALARFCPDIGKRSAFLCGPVEFMRAMQENLRELGMNMDLFYQESFTPTQSTPPNITGVIDTEDLVKVLIPSFGANIVVKHGSVLIDALEAEKIPVIAACRSGICGSCKCKVTQGEFTRTSTETLTEQEVEEGFVLACSCTVHSDVEVSLT